MFKKLVTFGDSFLAQRTYFKTVEPISWRDYICKENRLKNYSLLLILVLCFPMTIIYQKYLDPLFFVIFFGLIESESLKKILNNKSIKLISLYLYFTLFFIFSVNYYL